MSSVMRKTIAQNNRGRHKIKPIVINSSFCTVKWNFKISSLVNNQTLSYLANNKSLADESSIFHRAKCCTVATPNRILEAGLIDFLRNFTRGLYVFPTGILLQYQSYFVPANNSECCWIVKRSRKHWVRKKRMSGKFSVIVFVVLLREMKNIYMWVLFLSRWKNSIQRFKIMQSVNPTRC